jgi:transposase
MPVACFSPSLLEFDHDASRSGAVPVRLLEGYQGYLMTDGYDGHNALARTEGIEHLACMAHARRRFVEAARVQPKVKRGRADEAIELIGRLYGIERQYKAVDIHAYADPETLFHELRKPAEPGAV